jgi:signal transduction histidine kinase
LTLAALWAAGLFAHYWAVTRGWPLLPEAFSPHLDMSAVALTLAGILLGGMIWILWMKSSLDQRFAAHVIERANEVASHDGNLLHLEKEQARNEERQRIMQDLHDGIGSHLLLALMTVRHGAGAAVQNNVGQLLQECLDDLRLVIDALSGDSDLIPLLANFRVRMESRFDELALPLQWRNHSMPESCPIAHSTGLHLMRMLQEALANVLKHAQATQIHVDITFNREYLQLRISDDGRGIIGGNKTMGRGLNNMQIRAQKIGATVTLQHLAPGTAIVIDLPMQESGIADGSGTRKRSRDDG